MTSRLLVVLVLLVTTVCTDDLPHVSVPPVTPSPGLDLQLLRRLWAQPAIAPGAPCSVTTAMSQPNPRLGRMLGEGPARPVVLAAGAVLEYADPTDRADWTDKAWGGQKVLWAVDPAVSGPVLMRGRQLDGGGELAFE